MNSVDLLKLAFKNFSRRKVRSILAILGVVIGTAAIVAMLSLGIGMNESFKNDLSRIGSLNVIDVDPYYYPEDGMSYSGQPQQKTLDDESVAEIARIEGVEAVCPMLQTNLKFVSGKYTSYVNIVGIDPNVMENFDFKLASGRLLTDTDEANIVFGSQVPYFFRNSRERSGRYSFMMGNQGEPPVDVMLDRLVMTFDMSYGERKSPVIGPSSPGEENKKPPKLYNAKGVGMLAESQNERDWQAYINITYLKKIMKEYSRSQNSRDMRNMGMDTQQGYQQVKVKVADINDVQEVRKKINEMGFGAYSLADVLEQMQKTARTMQAVLGGIGAVSLLVAALGITNTMIMSIYERTREIGVMKVLGCRLGDIRRLFLTEAGFIGFIGGITGLLLSLGVSWLLNRFGGGIFGGRSGPDQNSISVIPMWLALFSVGFATFVGLVSGFFPARRAMKLSALEAIKTE